MEVQENIDFQRITKAIEFIQHNFKNQPELDDIANHVNLSPFHFHRMFTEWAGTSPKKFLQYITLDFIKDKIRSPSKISILNATHEAGLSSTSRLHDLFISLEAMTPAEFKHGGKNLSINYSNFNSPFGPMCIASTNKGICHLSFEYNVGQSIDEMHVKFPNAEITHQIDAFHLAVLSYFEAKHGALNTIKLHLKGTPFQLKVWEALLKIPQGNLSSYSKISDFIHHPNAARAVGSAIGSNPVAYLIPCHRVIQSSGIIGGYMWGSARKTAIIGWELSKK